MLRRLIVAIICLGVLALAVEGGVFLGMSLERDAQRAAPVPPATPAAPPSVARAKVMIAHACATAFAIAFATPTPIPHATPAPMTQAFAGLGKALGFGLVGGLCSMWEADPTLYLTATARHPPTPGTLPGP